MPLGGAGQAELWSRLGGTQPELSPPTSDEIKAWSGRRATECEEAGEWFGAAWHLDRLLEREPDAWREKLRRGDALAELGRWQPALTDHVAVGDRAAGRADVQSRLALLYFRNQDRAGYEKVCNAMLRKAGHDRDALQRAIWTCNLVGEAMFDRGAVLQAAERLAAEQPKDGRSLALLGAALYRAGRYDEAIAKLRPAVEMLSEEDAREASAFLALAQQHLGKTEDARHWLGRAQEKHDLLDDHAASWPRRLALRWLTCEAEAAVGD